MKGQNLVLKVRPRAKTLKAINILAKSGKGNMYAFIPQLCPCERNSLSQNKLYNHEVLKS